MAKARNMVVDGRFKGTKVKYYISGTTKKPYLDAGAMVCKELVASYELVNTQTVKSGSSAILRGVAGAALLGPVGALASITAKNNDIYLVLILWEKDNLVSFLELDRDLYMKLVQIMH